ncbi:hypothetical protein AB0C74_38825 [Spirillospora sp. NPDC048832]
MSSLTSAHLPAPEPGGSNEVDPGVVVLAITVMYLTTFFSLLGMGYPGEHALTLTVGAGLGSVTLIDQFGRYVSRRRLHRSRR